MNDSLIWLHEDALSVDHPVFRAAPIGAPALFVWDDAYLRQRGYSLKRLVFIYETLCELPVEIVNGDMRDILPSADASQIFMPATLNPDLQAVAEHLSNDKQVVVVADVPFVTLSEERDFVRFAQYWKRAQKTAILPNGGASA